MPNITEHLSCALKVSREWQPSTNREGKGCINQSPHAACSTDPTGAPHRAAVPPGVSNQQQSGA